MVPTVPYGPKELRRQAWIPTKTKLSKLRLPVLKMVSLVSKKASFAGRALAATASFCPCFQGDVAKEVLKSKVSSIGKTGGSEHQEWQKNGRKSKVPKNRTSAERIKIAKA